MLKKPWIKKVPAPAFAAPPFKAVFDLNEWFAAGPEGTLFCKMTTQIIDNLIYDVGMHNGQDTLHYLNRGFKVLAIEADPAVCRETSAKLGRLIRKGSLKILNVGISDKPGLENFYVNQKNSIWSSFNYELAARDPEHQTSAETETVKVRTVPFSEVLELYGMPYYLKIDIEGADPHCLTPLRKDYKPKYISMEFNGLQWISYLRDLGYTKFKLVNQASLGTMYASGDFGAGAIDIVSGKSWRSFEEVIASMNRIIAEKKLRGDPEFWYDIHAAYGEDEKRKLKPSLSARLLYLRHRMPPKKRNRGIRCFIGLSGRLIKAVSPGLYHFLKKIRNHYGM